MSVNTAEFVMSFFTEGQDSTVSGDLVIEEFDSWSNPEGALAIPTTWCEVFDPRPMEVALP